MNLELNQKYTTSIPK